MLGMFSGKLDLSPQGIAKLRVTDTTNLIPFPADITIKSIIIPTAKLSEGEGEPKIELRIAKPKKTQDNVLLPIWIHYHGGGFVIVRE